MPARLAAALAGAAALASPAAAQAAPTLEPLKPCYVSAGVNPITGAWRTERILVAGAGFTPGAAVDVQVDGRMAAPDVPVDETGAIAPQLVQSPLQERGQRPFAVTVSERDNPANTVTAETLASAIDVDVRPRRARPSQRIRFRGRGFTAGGPVYAHYVRKGKVRRTVRLSRATTGPCGRFSARRPQFPFKPSLGEWVLRIDQRRRYRKRAGTPTYTLRIFVQRKPRTRG